MKKIKSRRRGGRSELHDGPDGGEEEELHRIEAELEALGERFGESAREHLEASRELHRQRHEELREERREQLQERRREHREQSIADFVTRRFGRETYDWLVEPLLSGIFAGDGEQLSLDATFPRLIEAEREHGSVLGQMLRAKLRAIDPGADPIRTHRGVGYSVDVD